MSSDAVSPVSAVSATVPSAPVDGTGARPAGGGPIDNQAIVGVPPTPDPQAAPGKAPPSDQQTQAAVDAANRKLAESGREITFQFDAKLDRTIVKIVDSQTNKVVQQIPSEAMLAASRALQQQATRGVLVQTKV